MAGSWQRPWDSVSPAPREPLPRGCCPGLRRAGELGDEGLEGRLGVSPWAWRNREGAQPPGVSSGRAKGFFAAVSVALPGAQKPWKPGSCRGTRAHLPTHLAGHRPFPGAVHRAVRTPRSHGWHFRPSVGMAGKHWMLGGSLGRRGRSRSSGGSRLQPWSPAGPPRARSPAEGGPQVLRQGRSLQGLHATVSRSSCLCIKLCPLCSLRFIRMAPKP